MDKREFTVDEVTFRLYTGRNDKVKECLQVHGCNQYSYIRSANINKTINGLRRLLTAHQKGRKVKP